MLTRRRFLPLFAAAPLVACATGPIPSSARTTVILVRHADRAGDVLNSIGHARAKALPGALAGYDLDAIYSPDIYRNLQTAEPISQATGLPVTIINKEGAGARMVNDHPQGTVLWIGNKGNLRAIWDELGGSGPPPLEYGQIGVITLGPMGQRKVTRLRVNV